MPRPPSHPSASGRVFEGVTCEGGGIGVIVQGDKPMTGLGHRELLPRPFGLTPETQVSALGLNRDPESAPTPDNGNVVSGVCGHVLDKCFPSISAQGTQRNNAAFDRHRRLRIYCRLSIDPVVWQPSVLSISTLRQVNRKSAFPASLSQVMNAEIVRKT